jgi:DNA modification methylase
MCGDSTNAADVDNLMDNKKARLIVTDPPYNVDYEGKDGMKIKNDNMEDESFYNFLLAAFTCMFNTADDGCPIYVFHADSEGANFRKAFREAEFKLSESLVWVKNALVLGRQDYHWRHEPILYGWREGAAHYWNGQRDKTTFIEDDIDLSKLDKKELVALAEKLIDSYPQTVIRSNKPLKNDIHPTMKPLGLISYLVGNSSKKNDLVQDLFGGGGSTLMACEQTQRICYTMEMDEKYCDATVRRYAEFKGAYVDIFLKRNGDVISYSKFIEGEDNK